MEAKRNDKERNIIFLDIDGVLQPCHYQRRHDATKEEREALPAKLAEKYNNPVFLTCDIYDVAAVYYDWDKIAVDNLKSVLEFGKGLKENIEIVLISSWREYNTFEQMKAYFQVHDLQNYLTECVPHPERSNSKTKDLNLYLKAHPDINKYVIVEDDSYIKSDFPHHAIYMRSSKYEEIDAKKTIEYFKNVNDL